MENLLYLVMKSVELSSQLQNALCINNLGTEEGNASNIAIAKLVVVELTDAKDKAVLVSNLCGCDTILKDWWKITASSGKCILANNKSLLRDRRKEL